MQGYPRSKQAYGAGDGSGDSMGVNRQMWRAAVFSVPCLEDTWIYSEKEVTYAQGAEQHFHPTFAVTTSVDSMPFTRPISKQPFERKRCIRWASHVLNLGDLPIGACHPLPLCLVVWWDTQLSGEGKQAGGARTVNDKKAKYPFSSKFHTVRTGEENNQLCELLPILNGHEELYGHRIVYPWAVPRDNYNTCIDQPF